MPMLAHQPVCRFFDVKDHAVPSMWRSLAAARLSAD